MECSKPSGSCRSRGMSDFPDSAGMRSLLPAEPGRWVWSRLKVYLAVLVLAVVGFFFFADWYAGPAGRDPFTWFRAMWVLFGAIAAAYGWRTLHRELDK